METKKRNFYFDNLKAFLIISVIIGNSLELANPNFGHTHYFILFLYVFHMPLFAFVSGYSSSLSSRTTQQKVIDTVKLYCYAQVLYTAFNFFIMGKSAVNLQILMPQWTLWYLLSLIFWYLIEDYIHDHKVWILWGIVLSLILGLDASIETNGSVSRTLFFLPFFVMGRAFKFEYVDIIKRNRVKILVGGLISLVILWYFSDETPVELFFEYAKYTWYFEKPWFPMFMRAFHYVSAVIVSLGIMSLVPNIDSKVGKIGKYSLVIYLAHSGIAQILIEFGILKYNNVTQVVISTIIYVVIVVSISFIWVGFRNKKTYL